MFALQQTRADQFQWSDILPPICNFLNRLEESEHKCKQFLYALEWNICLFVTSLSIQHSDKKSTAKAIPSGIHLDCSSMHPQTIRI